MGNLLLSGLDHPGLTEFFNAMEQAVDQTGSGLAVSLVEGSRLRLLHASRGAATIFGYPEDELRGRLVHELIAPDELERTRTIIREVNEGARPPALIRTTVVQKNGSRAPIEVGTTRIRIGERALAVAFIRDISETLAAEEELRRSEARFRIVVENAPDGVAILRDSRIAYLNPTAARMLGFERPESAVGTDIASVLIPEHGDKARERIAETIRAGVGLRPSTEYTVKDSGTPPRTCEVVSVPIEFEGAPAVIGFARDVTDRKAMQDKLAKADRLATIGALAGAMAHEINNPLAGVQMGLETIERQLAAVELPHQTAGSLRRALAESKEGVLRIERTVRSLGATSTAPLDVRRQVPIEATIERAILLCENEIRHRALLVRTYSAVPPVFGSQSHLEQVFLNLLVNAAQSFSGPNAEDNQILITTRSTNGRVFVEVTDNGAGIERELHERIFDPFFTTKSAAIGTGLGLTICRRIVEDHGGTIEVESALDRGTTFRVNLPAHEGPARESAVRHGAPPAVRRSVLLVDDEPLIRTLFTKLLQPIHEIVTADSAAGAIQLLASRRDFDVILCDLMMPRMNGKQLYETIRDRWPGLDRRIAFITGGVFDPALTQFLSDVPNPKLLKPFLLADVLRVIEIIATESPIG